ncbi:MAG: ThiF family adenylyltransferase [Nanoarchaeota archaeon]|nr:ThiF family adenylyltransferase [Nanoarchaeota archaeon]
MKIVVIGCGTSGNLIIPRLEGNLLLIDRDIVEEKNLERQRLFKNKDIGQPKCKVLGEKFNTDFKILDLDYTNVNNLQADLVIDCTDNLETRFLINEYCMKNNIPWIYTGIVGDRGRVMAITGDFCFKCFFSEVKGLDTCTTAGVNLEKAEEMSKVAVEEINRIIQGKKSRGLWANGEWIKVNQNKDCPVCNGDYEYLEGKQEKIIKFCGSSRFQFKGNFDYENVRKRLNGSGDWFVYEDFYIFRDRVLVKADSEEEAKLKFTEVIGN